MLVLSRKTGQQVLIPDLNISITVLSAERNRVQLGIRAPREIDITRPDTDRRPAHHDNDGGPEYGVEMRAKYQENDNSSEAYAHFFSVSESAAVKQADLAAT